MTEKFKFTAVKITRQELRERDRAPDVEWDECDLCHGTGADAHPTTIEFYAKSAGTRYRAYHICTVCGEADDATLIERMEAKISADAHQYHLMQAEALIRLYHEDKLARKGRKKR